MVRGMGGGCIRLNPAPGLLPGTTLLNMNSNTVISQDNPLFQTLGTLHPGEKVQFSGQLFPSSSDCIGESSATMSGSMQNPLFLIRFTSIKAEGG